MPYPPNPTERPYRSLIRAHSNPVAEPAIGQCRPVEKGSTVDTEDGPVDGSCRR